MKSILLILSMVILSLAGNNLKAKPQTGSFPDVKSNTPKDYVEVLYFHGKQRCATCVAIENITKELIEKDFTEQVKNGKVVFKEIDISTKEGEKIADTYEVTWSSLFVNKWKDGKETKNNMTDFGFSHAKSSPEVFKAGVKKKIDELLK